MKKNRTQPNNQSSSRTRSSKTGRLSRGGTCGGRRHQYQRPLTTPNFELLPEQELSLEVGRTWFLDQEIPKAGFISIQDSSLLWDEWVERTRIITTEGLTTCWNRDTDGRLQVEPECALKSAKEGRKKEQTCRLLT